MISRELLDSYVQWEEGLISPHVFSSEEVYKLEQEKVFGHSWLFLAHDSQIPRPGDFFATYMGGDPVLIVRQSDGTVAAFLNACRHRGMKVCRGDEGNAKAFTCTYHGWSYDTAGRLVGMPDRASVYGERDLDMSRWGLVPVDRLDHYKGFWFGSFDPEIVDLTTHLGAFTRHMDTFLDTMPGGVEFVGGTQKVKMGGNWKIAAEQFTGDSYHAATSHISDFGVTTPPELLPVRGQEDHGPVGFHHFGSLLGHGAGFNTTRNPRKFETAGATDVIDKWQDSIESEVNARHGEDGVELYRGVVQHANLFPNLSFLSTPTTIRVWHPRGPHQMEMYSWTYVDKDAPAEVKDQQRWITQHHFGPQGLAEQDDGENFAAIGANLRTGGAQTHKMMLHYRMGLSDADGTTQTAEGGRRAGMGEMPQRLFYRRWLELMTAE